MQDYVGMKFNRLTITKFAYYKDVSNGKNRPPRNVPYFECMCDCGSVKVVSLFNLRKGAVKSCGCLQKESNDNRVIDISGNVYGMLEVISRSSRGGRYWRCLCQCGNYKDILYSSLTLGLTKSCGCLHKKQCKDNIIGYIKKLRREAGLSEDIPISSENKLQRVAFIKLAHEIYKRDGYSCVWCGDVDSKLNAHHLTPWAGSSDLEKFDPLNVVSLCLECHDTIHKGNNFLPPDATMTILLRGYTSLIEDIDWQTKDSV